MAVNVFMVAFIAMAFCQPTKLRRTAGICFAVPVSILHYFHKTLADVVYYVSDAAVLGLVVVLLAAIRPVTPLIDRLQIACIIGIILNGGGLLVCYFKLPGIIYELPFYILYAAILLIMALTDRGDYVGGFRFSFRFVRDRVNTLARRLYCSNEKA